MKANDEASALLDVELRLGRRFPSVARTVVRQVVAKTYGTMTGPIRDFVPLLVEHQARDVLAAGVQQVAPPSRVSPTALQGPDAGPGSRWTGAHP